MSVIPYHAWWRPEAAPAADTEAAAGSRLGFRALLAFTVILVAAPQEFFVALKPMRLALVAALVAIACYLSDRLAERVTTPIAREVWITLALVAWAVAMVPLSYWPGGSVSMLLDLYFKSVALFVLLAGVITTRRRLRLIIWTLGACALPIAVTALRHFRSGDFIASAPGR